MNEILSKIVSNLLQNRDFIGHQLSHAQGKISDLEFKKIFDKYFSDFDSESYNTRSIILLRSIIGSNKLNTDIVSVSLKYSLKRAEVFLSETIALKLI